MHGPSSLLGSLGVLVLLLAAGTAAQDSDVGAAKHNRPPGGKRSVCIIGAGPGGLSSALRLREKGYRDITVFERNAVPGGKSITLEVESYSGRKDAPIYLGALLGIWGGYPSVSQLLQQYKVPISNLSYAYTSGPVWKPGDDIGLETIFVNHETGTILPFSPVSLDLAALTAAVGKYTGLYMQAKPFLVPGFTKGIPAELRQSYGSWIRANGLEPLLPAVYVVITAYGYGSLEDIPTFYAMCLVDPFVFQAFAGLGGSYLVDYKLLWSRVAADLASSGVKFVYNADISKVWRSSSGHVKSTIRYTIQGKQSSRHHGHTWSKTAKCDRIIAAFPHNKKNLAAFDLDAQELAVFDRVRQVQFYSGAVDLPNSSKGRFFRLLKLTGVANPPFTLAEPPGDGFPVAYTTWPYTYVANFWTWVAGDTEMPMDTIAANALATMSKYNRNVSESVTEAVPLTKADLRVLYKWDYFAHFDVNTLTDTLFAQLEALQGRRGTFFTSSLRSFESQEMVTRSAYDIVDRYF